VCSSTFQTGCLKICLWKTETIKRNTSQETLKITISAKKKKTDLGEEKEELD
jgi:hypothetical protein